MSCKKCKYYNSITPTSEWCGKGIRKGSVTTCNYYVSGVKPKKKRLIGGQLHENK